MMVLPRERVQHALDHGLINPFETPFGIIAYTKKGEQRAYMGTLIPSNEPRKENIPFNCIWDQRVGHIPFGVIKSFHIERVAWLGDPKGGTIFPEEFLS